MVRNITTSTASDALKILYPQDRLEMLWKRRFPLLAEISKADEFTGSTYTVAVNYDGPADGATIQAAQGMRSGSLYGAFAVTRAARYAVGWVDNEAVMASRDKKGAHVKLLEREFEATLFALQRWVALGLYRSGGSLGQIATGGVAGNVMTLTNKADCYNFSIGQTLVLNTSADGTGTTHSGTGEDHTITAIDHDAGTITVDTIDTAAAAADYIFTATAITEVTSGRHITGLAGWNPLTAGTTLFGLDRSVATATLQGHRLNNTSLPISEIISELAYRVSYTGQANRAYLNPIQFNQLSKEMTARGMRELDGGDAVSGFKSFTIATGAGDVTVVGDPACPEDRVHVVDLSAIHLPHLGGCPQIMDEDGRRAGRVDFSNGDFLEFGMRFLGNMVAWKPGCLGVGALSPVL